MLKLKIVKFVVLVVSLFSAFNATAQTIVNIDPSEDERPLPPMPGKPKPYTMGQWDMVVNSETQIDPEREYPILGKPKGLNIDPEREYPILGKPKGLNIDPETEYPILGKKNPLILNIDPEREYPILGKKGILSLLQDGGLTALQVQEWARTLTIDPEMQMYAVKLSLSAVAASMFITLYRMAALGGRQRVLAAIIPPEIILDQLGRSGYRVPAHNKYAPEDAKVVAQTLVNLPADQVPGYIESLDVELVEYLSTIIYYIRAAQAQELSNWCPNPDLCA